MVIFRQRGRNRTVGQGVIEKHPQGKEGLKHVILHNIAFFYTAPTSQQLVELQTSKRHFYS